MFAIFGEFVRNFGLVFAILFEGLLAEIQEEMLRLAVWEGGLRGTTIVNKKFVNKLAFLKRVERVFVGFGKRGLLEKGSFQKSPFSRDSREFRDSRDFREPPESVENKGESNHFLEILENLEILEILEISPVKRPLS